MYVSSTDEQSFLLAAHPTVHPAAHLTVPSVVLAAANIAIHLTDHPVAFSSGCNENPQTYFCPNPEDVCPLPKDGPRRKKHLKGLKGKQTEILTDAPVKMALETDNRT